MTTSKENDFQPIPGVRYEVKIFKEDKVHDVQAMLYAPICDGDPTPWWWETLGEWISLSETDEVVGITYNPHPPTRTEWSTAGPPGYGRYVGGKSEIFAWAKVQDEIQPIYRREVTEWVEVNKKESSDGRETKT